jgi:sigma-B regulation protein RsbU (phosphoserine phosphatase)
MKAPQEIKILVVEDDPYFQRILSRRLQAEGYQVFTACDGREGMKAIVTQDPELVISDWMMPHVDGLELCQSVKTGLREAAPYFILLTAKGELNDKVVGLETGADDYLVKPCEQSEILARVRAGLRTVLLARELREKVAELNALATELENARDEMRQRAVLSVCPACRRVHAPDGGWDDLHHHLFEAGLADWSLAPCPECELSATPRRR